MQIQGSVEAELRECVRDAGMRMNKTKLRVFELLISAKKPLSVQDMVEQIDDVHYVSIYRTVDALRKVGVVAQVPQGFKNLYELSDLFHPHHHHITCERCGNTSTIDDAGIEQLIEKVSQNSGYISTRHHLELYGLCGICKKP